MNNPKISLIAISLLLVFSGCASKPKEIVSLPESLQKEIKSTDVHISNCQKEMCADVERSNIATYCGGGLLLALVDCAVMSHREDKANEAMVDINKSLQSYNIQKQLTDNLIGKLKSTEWLNVQSINCIEKIDEQSLRDITTKTNSDSLLTAMFKYNLNPEFTVLTGNLYLTIYPASPKIKKMINCEDPVKTPIFKVRISATESLTNAGEDIQANAAMWTQENGAYLKRCLDNILQKVLMNLDTILKNPNHLPGDE